MKMEEEVCLTGNMIRTLVVFGYGEDPRLRKAIDWMPEHQQEDGGWNCDYPLRKGQTQLFHVHNRTVMGLLGDSTIPMDEEDETLD